MSTSTTFEGKTALITGSARGLGREYAQYFAEDRANVVVSDVNEVGAEETAAEIRKGGGNAIAVKLDVTDMDSARAAVDAAVTEFGALHILVNNAGLWGDYQIQGALGQDVDKWRTTLEVNLTGPFICSKVAAPVMQTAGWGRIVNISSIGSYMPGSGAYGVTKLALHQLTYQIASEVGEHGITCNAVAPGSIKNEATLRQVPEEFFDLLLQQCAIKRPGTGRDMYGAIRFLCSDDASWVTGQVLSPNGGAVARF